MRKEALEKFKTFFLEDIKENFPEERPKYDEIDKKINEKK